VEGFRFFCALFGEEAVIKQLLLAPGPTPVPARVRAALARPVIHHRTPQFGELFGRARAGLRELFGTSGDVLILSSSGTGAMESAVVNCFAPGDKVLVVNGGKFGERWLELAKMYSLEAVEIQVEWGRAVRIEQIEQALSANSDVRGIFVQGSETSTTTCHPVAAIAELTRKRDVLLAVDGITAVGVYEMPMDQLGIDILVTGSQKALMLPPGLACIALSDRAWERSKTVCQPRYYFDLARERAGQAKNSTAYTPAISLIFGLEEALAMMKEEGWENLYARHDRNARAARAGVEALGLQLLSPEDPSPAATGLFVPEGIDGKKLHGYLRDKMGIAFAGGQGHLKGKILRIGHLGYIGAFDIVNSIAALEMGLRHFGHDVVLGRGVGAAQEVLMSALPD
jgi:aspartate aminotransferase-like enzyme